MRFLIINGPNLNLLGKREPEIYGNVDFGAFINALSEQSDHTFEYYQSNVEGEIINALQSADNDFDGVILNAGGYTHTSVAIADAIAAIDVPVVEVHISNVHAREEYRHTSIMAKNCAGVITGFGLNSYALAVQALEMMGE